MTNTKFLCGRLLVYKDGSTKRVVLAGGGGARECTISHIDMGFEEIHDRLREIFLEGTNSPSKLYDFESKELDTSRYTTFYDYIQRRGLRFKGTLLYLGTAADGENIVTPRSPERRRITAVQPIQNPGPVVRIPQVEADSSTPAIAIKTDNDRPSMNELSVNNHRTENVSRSSSSSTYSFEISLNDFVDYLRDLINRYNHESILLQLFEYICTIRALSSMILDRLKRQIQSVNEHRYSIYNDGLEKIEKISRSIKALIELNKMKISHIDQHSVINNSFNRFHQNFNILREQWVNNRNPPRHSTNYTVDPVPSTCFASSSSSRHHSENNSRKRTHASSRSPHRSYRRSNDDDDDDDEKYSLFKNLLKSLDHLLDILHQRRFTSFYYMVESIIGEIKQCRSIIKLSDYRSLYDAEQFIISIENRLTNRINDEYRRASPHGINPQLEHAFDKTLDSIRHLLSSFHHYQSQINKHKRSRPTTHRSSPSEEKPIVNKSTQPKPRIDHDDDQSSEASHSSIGDEVLMEVAKDAYEQRPNRYK